MSEKLPVGVIGVGHLGRHHARKYQDNARVHLVGVVDARSERAQMVAEETDTQVFTSLEALLPQVRAVSVATPTIDHFAVVQQCLAAGVHVLVEKPMTATVAEAEALAALQARQGLVLAVGHIKRLHPAITHLQTLGLGAPRYLEAHRLAPFKPRSLDVDVIMDLMIHDLDLALLMTGQPVQEVRAVGVPVITDKVDMANAWISFAGGCVANIAASRVVREPVRQIRLFWNDRYASVDFLANTLRVYTRGGQSSGPIPGISNAEIELPSTDVLALEIDAFLDAVSGQRPVFCDAQAGKAALVLAQSVRTALEQGSSGFIPTSPA